MRVPGCLHELRRADGIIARKPCEKLCDVSDVLTGRPHLMELVDAGVERLAHAHLVDVAQLAQLRSDERKSEAKRQPSGRRGKS